MKKKSRAFKFFFFFFQVNQINKLLSLLFSTLALNLKNEKKKMNFDEKGKA